MKFNVRPMTCGRCVRTITQAIQAIDPRAEVNVDLDQGTVAISGLLAAGQAVEAIEAAGYHAEPVEPDAERVPAAGGSPGGGCCGTCHA